MNTRSLLTITHWLEQQLWEGFRRANSTGRPFWVGDVIDINPINPYGLFDVPEDFAWLSFAPDEHMILGMGIAQKWSWSRPDGWDHMERVLEMLQSIGLADWFKITGGHSFWPDQSRPAGEWAEFPQTFFVLPAIQIDQSPAGTRLGLAAEIYPGQDIDTMIGYYRSLFRDTKLSEPEALPSVSMIQAIPPRNVWLKSVERAVQAMHEGRMNKVVLARNILADFCDDLFPGRVLKSLHESNPDATTFGIRQNQTTFLGATPEALVSVQNNALSSMCLAGSAPRGTSPTEDYTLQQNLLSDAKILSEHATVRRHIKRALSPITISLDIPTTPTIRKFPTVQHLFTPVHGVLSPQHNIFSAIKALQPTPAVAGTPTAEATQWIRHEEPFDRGWYAGSVGHVDMAGNGTFVVALRSGLITRRQASLYAGCGLMEDSRPAWEWEESRWKFRTMLHALGIEGDEFP